MNWPRVMNSHGRTRFARNGAARLAYDPGTAPNATSPTQPAVLLHPLLGDRRSWDAVRELLIETDPALRVVRPESRGHGASTSIGTSRLTSSALASDVLAVLDSAEITTCHLVGWDLGGAIGLAFAQLHPERVASLTLIAPSLWFLLVDDTNMAIREQASTLMERLRSAAELAERGLIDQALSTVLDQIWGAEWRARLSRTRLATVRRHASAIAGTMTALANWPDACIGRISPSIPLLIIYGANATDLDRALADRLVARSPQCRVATIPQPIDAAMSLTAEAATEICRLLSSVVSNWG